MTERGSGTDEHPADVGEAEEGEVVGMVGGDGGYPPSLPESEAEGAVALAGGTVLLVGAESRGGSGSRPRVEAELAAEGRNVEVGGGGGEKGHPPFALQPAQLVEQTYINIGKKTVGELVDVGLGHEAEGKEMDGVFHPDVADEPEAARGEKPGNLREAPPPSPPAQTDGEKTNEKAEAVGADKGAVEVDDNAGDTFSAGTGGECGGGGQFMSIDHGKRIRVWLR